MKTISKTMLLVILLSIGLGHSAYADMSCSKLLAPQKVAKAATPRDFFVEDVEKLFLEILIATEAVAQAEPGQVAAKADDLISLKAHFMNMAMSLIFSSPPQTELPIKNLYEMIVAIGVPAKEIKETADARVPAPVRKTDAVVQRLIKKQQIGFLRTEEPPDLLPEDDTRRSIGFGEVKQIAPETLDRSPNQISITFSPKARFITVIDRETGRYWGFDANDLMATGFEDDTYVHQLMYNGEIEEYIVMRVNHANPNPQIGFKAPEVQ